MKTKIKVWVVIIEIIILAGLSYLKISDGLLLTTLGVMIIITAIVLSKKPVKEEEEPTSEEKGEEKIET